MKELNKRILFITGILIFGLGLGAVYAQKDKDKKNGKEAQTETKPAAKKPRYVTPQPQPDEYEDDYDDAEYERFKKLYDEKDIPKRADSLMDYIQNGKSLTLKTYAIGAFSGIYDEYRKAGNKQGMADIAEKFLKIPRDKLQALDKAAVEENKKREEAAKKIKEGEKPTPLVAAGEQTYKTFIATTAAAYYEMGNKPKTAEWGEKYFAETKKPETAYILATTYREMKNNPKFIEWSQKALEMNRDNPNIQTDLSVDLFRYYVREKNNAQAIKYAQIFMKTLPNAKKPASLSEAQWNSYKNGNMADAYFLQAEDLYEHKKYKDAQPLFEQVLKYDPKRDVALYRVGFIHWHLQDGEKAMETFACCEKLKGPTAATCKAKLAEIYKSLHNGTTVGIDKVYQRAPCK